MDKTSERLFKLVDAHEAFFKAMMRVPDLRFRIAIWLLGEDVSRKIKDFKHI